MMREAWSQSLATASTKSIQETAMYYNFLLNLYHDLEGDPAYEHTLEALTTLINQEYGGLKDD